MQPQGRTISAKRGITLLLDRNGLMTAGLGRTLRNSQDVAIMAHYTGDEPDLLRRRALQGVKVGRITEYPDHLSLTVQVLTMNFRLLHLRMNGPPLGSAQRPCRPAMKVHQRFSSLFFEMRDHHPDRAADPSHALDAGEYQPLLRRNPDGCGLQPHPGETTLKSRSGVR